MKFRKKTAIVTGGARGIGLEICKQFLLHGADVICLDVNEPDSTKVSNLNSQFKYIAFDLENTKSFLPFFESLIENSPPHFLVNNARFKDKSSLNTQNLLSWNKAISVGLTAPFFLSQLFIEKALPNGSIINICSVASILATTESPAYHAVKGGMLALTRYLAVGAGPKKIRVNALLPGLIVQEEHTTRYMRDDNEAYRQKAEKYQPMGSVGSSKDVAEAVMYLCSDKSKYISGVALPVDGGASVQEQFSLLSKI